MFYFDGWDEKFGRGMEILKCNICEFLMMDN